MTDNLELELKYKKFTFEVCKFLFKNYPTDVDKSMHKICKGVLLELITDEDEIESYKKIQHYNDDMVIKDEGEVTNKSKKKSKK